MASLSQNDLIIKDQNIDQSEKLFSLISEFIQHFKNSPDPRIQSLVIVARRLKIFGCQQIQFFNSNLLQPSDDFPKEYIFSLLNDQIGRDFSIIREAACQRAHSDDLSRETFENCRLSW